MTDYKISDNLICVDTNYFWRPIDDLTPRYVKLQLLSKGGIAMHGVLQKKQDFYTHWTPLPSRAK